MCGKPLLAYSINAAKESNCFDRVMVSTDSEKYAQVARKYKADVPFLRDVKTSGDNAGSWDVVREVLAGYNNMGIKFDTVCLLQPTSPLRSAEDIIGAYTMMEKNNADAITSVCKCDHPIEYMMTLDETFSLYEYRQSVVDCPRQTLPTYYRLNGAIYIRKIRYCESTINIISDNEYAYLMNRERSVDIDTIDDFEYAEFLMGK